MSTHPSDTLTPEEREIAERLARIGPHGMPSSALDARILGAAQAAAARKSTARPRRHWPAWAGIAATLALALGAVWQLRPVPEVPVALDEAPSRAAVRQQSEAVVPGEIEPGEIMSGETQAAEVRAAKVAPPEPREELHERTMPPPSAASRVVFDDPSPIDAPAPVAPPAPPPPPPPLQPQVQPAPAVAAAPSQRYPPPPSATPMARKSTAAATMESAASDLSAIDADAGADTDTGTVEVTVTDLPVASDRRLAPLDWIERIRQRRDAGDLVGARASLSLLQRDHPQLVLPDDVRTIATSAAADRPQPDRPRPDR